MKKLQTFAYHFNFIIAHEKFSRLFALLIIIAMNIKRAFEALAAA